LLNRRALLLYDILIVMLNHV